MADDRSDVDFENLLNYLHQSRALDFTGYKRNSLKRLTKRRMQRVGQTVAACGFWAVLTLR